MKHIKRDFILKALVRVRWVDLGGGAQAKFKLFQNMVMLHIKLIKADDAGSNMVANILSTDTPLTQGVGSKGQAIVVVVVVVYKFSQSRDTFFRSGLLKSILQMPVTLCLL